ncbi:MAG TPA: hypothetical protein VFL59_13335 [Candidatus Nanopelagicales bacterium]|nr:hypothetical protein [Candidatus Nanopelagicales bacterium]
MTDPKQVPAEEVDLGLDEDESPADQHEAPQPDHIVSPDDPDDPARAPETLGIDNTDTALGAEDDSAPVE